ncbi:hypothetical protein JXA34_04205 [Patescibacteria group bacterium]|nr:hypothetical protein [Patescibacteria group bacterium]
MLSYLFYGILAGTHRAAWGGFKDTPYEPYKLSKSIRSVILGGLWGVFQYCVYPLYNIDVLDVSPAFVYLVSLSLDTLTTEYYKLFVRRESQERYKIPSTFHLLKLEANPYVKFFAGILLMVIAYTVFVFSFGFNLPTQSEVGVVKVLLVGAGLGLFAGVLEAVGGSWKDAPFEGFSYVKFFRSPIVSTLWGVLLSLYIGNLGILLFSIAGGNRITVEFYKTFIKHNKVGKFKRAKPEFPEWVKRRKVFLIPYVITWVFFLAAFLFS